jgi:ATP-dependent helicase IRC3
LAHREELVDQAYAQIRRQAPHLRVAIDLARRHANVADADVVIASVQSLSRANSVRIRKYDPKMFKAIFIDEAHHAAAATYIRILDHFGARDPASHVFVFGCSATAMRHDGLCLGTVFDEIVYHRDMRSMMTDNWLCDLKVTTVKTNVDLSGLKTSQSDYDLSALSRRMNIPARNELIVQSWMDHQQRLGLCW